ncbi:MAG TPA: hypothetical protein VG738_15555 [Chitinophagaceae bacterium]|nr:hypothetical protein [Chitinophagaceae bacterium]
MEDIELQKLWAEIDNKLEQAKLLNLQSWALNLQNKEAQQMAKAQHRLRRVTHFKLWAVVLGIVWAALLLFLVFNHLTWQGIFFNISAGTIAALTILAVVVYIWHIVLLKQVDESNTIAETQQTLARLQSSTIRIAGIGWLQMPFYATFFITPAMLHNAGAAFWVIELTVTGLLTSAAIWLYRNIHYRNMHKKWFKILFSSPEWTQVIKAMEFLQEVDEWKKTEFAG